MELRHEGSDHDEPALRLVGTPADAGRSEGAATAFRLGDDRFGELYDLDVLDYGDRGCVAVSDAWIDPGTVVSLGFECPYWTARRGVVTHCEPCDGLHRLSIEFSGRLAA